MYVKCYENIYRGAPRLHTDRRAQSAKRGVTRQPGLRQRSNRGYPPINMPNGIHGPNRMERNGLSITPTDEEYKDERYLLLIIRDYFAVLLNNTVSKVT